VILYYTVLIPNNITVDAVVCGWFLMCCL